MHWTETFFNETYRRIGLEPALPRGEEEAVNIKKALKLKKGSSLLDLCCGIGRYTVPLGKLGLEVTGLDLNGSYLEQAKKRAADEGVNARFVEADMRDIPFAGEFKAVINMFSSFGYFSENENQGVLKQIAKSLKPGGKALIDLMNRDFFLANYWGYRIHEKDGLRILDEQSYDPHTSRVKTSWKIIKGDRLEPMGSFDIRLYSLHEMEAMIEKAGLETKNVYGGLDLQNFDISSRRIVLIAKKA